MRYIADLHIHSCYSRATSKASRLPGLAAWAAIKGIQVLGTGDFTHPGWVQHLNKYLVPAEPGFFKLATWDNDEIAAVIPEGLDPDDLPIGDIRFVLSSEISSIYKKDDKVRKIHNILYAPDFETVRRVNKTLAGIGNIESDGRPILGLDARNLLEILLENGPDGFLVPAHIWTPWFSLFGSKSGFDALEECFGDLSPEIFALETGLSSDPAMNRCISALDRYTLISNSDCHSPSKLGREANVFTTRFDFPSLQSALRSPVDRQGQQVFSATIEFYPEEGKYHCDGHRKCHACLEPHETIESKGLCPVCGRPVTVGVLHRVMELADRKSPEYPENSPAVHSLIPLPEILSELFGVGPGSKKIMRTYGRLINTFTSEFNVLLDAKLEDISDFGSPVLAEAIGRVRSGKVIRQPGYDGEFGVIRVFAEDELSRLSGQLNLFGETARPPKKKRKRQPKAAARPNNKKKEIVVVKKKLNSDQQAAVESAARHILVQAGPGTGKTHTLVARLLYQLRHDPGPATVITFTNKAANEVRERLSRTGVAKETVFVTTLHSYCLHFLRLQDPSLRVAGPEMRALILRRIFPGLGPQELSSVLEYVEKYDLSDERAQKYFNALTARHLLDLTAVIPSALALLNSDNIQAVQAMRQDTGALYIDEFQDLNSVQYALVKTLAESSGVFAIGDPDQAIYGFRGADPRWFYQFVQDVAPEVHRLQHNYRSDKNIIRAASAVIAVNTLAEQEVVPESRADGVIFVHKSANRFTEAAFVTRMIEELLGGTSHREIDRLTTQEGADHFALQDIGVLYRTTRQAEVIAEALHKQGLPCQLVDLDPFYTKGPLNILYHWILIAAELADLSHLLFLLGLEQGIGPATLLRIEQEMEDVSSESASLLSVLSRQPGAVGKASASFKVLARSIQILSHEHGVTAGLSPVLERYHIAEEDVEVQRFLRLAGAIADSLQSFADYLLHNGNAILFDDQAEAVTLMTLHAAKGVEFPVVFLVGLEDDRLPLQPREKLSTAEYLAHVEEERRLFFVGLTRAKHQLYLSWSPQGPEQAGSKRPSRFIGEIPAALITQPLVRKKKRPRHTQLPLFPLT